MKIRTLVERLARGRVLKRTLPNGTGIFISPDAQLKYLKSHFDDDLVALAQQCVAAGDTVWDIGSNCGVFAFSCSHASRVLAVEADPFLADLLRKSAQANGAPVEVLACAVSGQSGVAAFSIAERGRASNHLSEFEGSSQSGGERGRLLVPTLTLDELYEFWGKAPDVIKIDVEGAEVSVLSGGEKLFATAKPLIWIETTDATHERCREILERHGYRMDHGAGANWLCLPERQTVPEPPATA